MFLLAICVSSFLKYLFVVCPFLIFFGHFQVGLFFLLLLIGGIDVCMHILDKTLLSEICNADIFSQTVAYLSFL